MKALALVMKYFAHRGECPGDAFFPSRPPRD